MGGRRVALALWALGAGVASADSAAVVVGHAEAAAVAELPQATMDRVGQLRWFFAHASVGANMTSGLAALRAANAARYPLAPASDDAFPPAAPVAGRVYDYSRGNPGWQAKVTTFATYVGNGWRYPKVNLVLNKFCYIDPDADVNAYIQSMAALESNFPETVVIYATIPVMTGADADGYRRSIFNDALREWVSAHGRVLFDIADIEAHDTNGVAQTFIYSGRTCQRLFGGYTTDGGHLNDLGSRQVAKGFYALGAALFAADRDGDGLCDGEELLAGSSPAAHGSCFRMQEAAPAARAGEMVFRWSSSSNRVYALQRRGEIRDAVGWSNVVADISATPPLNTYTGALPAAGKGLYRVTVRQR